jgi:hypothetical protein
LIRVRLNVAPRIPFRFGRSVHGDYIRRLLLPLSEKVNSVYKFFIKNVNLPARQRPEMEFCFAKLCKLNVVETSAPAYPNRHLLRAAGSENGVCIRARQRPEMEFCFAKLRKLNVVEPYALASRKQPLLRAFSSEKGGLHTRLEAVFALMSGLLFRFLGAFFAAK